MGSSSAVSHNRAAALLWLCARASCMCLHALLDVLACANGKRSRERTNEEYSSNRAPAHSIPVIPTVEVVMFATSYGSGTKGSAMAPAPISEKRRRIEAVGVVVSFIVMIVMNVLSNFCGQGKDPICKNNAQQSDANPTYLTPDGVTFAIWGLIYLMELIFTVYQALPSSKGGGFGVAQLDSCRPYVISAFVLNGLWLILFSFSLWWLSQLVIVSYLYCIVKAYEHLQISWFSQVDEDGAAVPISRKICCYAAFGLQTGWLVVATTLGLGVVGRNNGWTPPPDFGVMMITVIVLLNAYLSLTRADAFYNFISCWALAGIVRMQNDAPASSSKPSVLPRSDQIIHWCNFGFYCILIVGIIGLVRAVIMRNSPQRLRKSFDSDEPALASPLV